MKTFPPIILSPLEMRENERIELEQGDKSLAIVIKFFSSSSNLQGKIDEVLEELM